MFHAPDCKHETRSRRVELVLLLLDYGAISYFYVHFL